MFPKNVFWTSDLHFDHKMMVRRFRASMGWASPEAMTDYLIEQWNAIVPERGARVYVLGDFSFANAARTIEILDRLHGEKCLVRGNHDKVVDKAEVKKRFTWIKDYDKVKITDPASPYQNKHGGDITTPGEQPIIMSHYPMLTWDGSGHGSWMLHGHCHGNLNESILPPAKRLDVGVDVHNFRPITYEQIKAIMDTKGSVPVDHHTGKEYD